MTDDSDLLALLARLKPELRSIEASDYLDALWSVGSPVEALFYSRLFWPRFVRVHGCLFLSGTVQAPDDDGTIAELLARNGQDRRLTERALNRTPLVELFEAHASELDDAGFRELGSILVKTWKAALDEAFPEDHYEVEVVEDPAVGTTITFYRGS